MLIGILDDSGWLESVARGITQAVQGSVPLAFVGIVLCAMLASAVIDNVPFLVAMLPVTQHVADQLGASTELLMFGLLIGACLGGNITPIGASANVVAIGILHRHGHPTTFMEFVRVGLPFTLAALLAGATVIWLVWA